MITIARLTFREMLNKRILLLGLVLTVVYLSILWLGLHYVGKDIPETAELVRLSLAGELLTAGLFVSGMLVSLVTVFSSAGAISADIENGIMPATAAKPISRTQIFLGKYAGLGLALVVYSLFVFIATNMIVWRVFHFYSDGFFSAMVLFALQPLVLLAVNLWGSTFLSTLGNGVFMFMLYSVAVIGGMLEYVGVQMSSMALTAGASGTAAASSLTMIGILTSLLLPVDSLYRLVNYLLLQGSPVPAQLMRFTPFLTITPPSMEMLAYTAGYILLFIGLGIYKLSSRDL
ncbi:MAG: ABC transporter permease [Syntrophomonadaceae bacterium]|nr:ABC transporter permease [Syntrophomonadaceae bacterium]